MKKASLTLNTKPATPELQPGFATFTFNLTAASRNDNMAGKDYLVVPMVMMTEGVHNGSNGALYYPADELSKVPETWDHKPVVVYHPTKNGQGVSACSPEIITKYSVGVIMNTKFEDGKLKSEAWLDPQRVSIVDNRVMLAVNKNEMMEVSTGVYTENEITEGEWNGKKYIAIARNYRADHLAILPDQIGACSIKDGAGLMRNQAKGAQTTGAIRLAFNRLMEEFGLKSNDLSHSDIRSQLCDLVRQKYPKEAGQEYYSVWVEDVFENFFVYEAKNKLWRMNYEHKDNKVTISGDPVEVRRVTKYETVDGGVAMQQNQQTIIQPQKDNTMDKKTIVDGLIGNAGWSETDREFLMSLNEAQLGKISKPATPPAQPAAPAANAATTQQPQKPVSVDEYITNAPAEVRSVLRASLASHETEKSKLIAAITANKANVFTENQLRSKELDELQAIAALCPAPTANYAGMGHVATITENAGVPALDLPSMDFSTK